MSKDERANCDAALAIQAADDKYVYFLMATASAAIFVALQRTVQSTYDTSQILLGLALFCWIVSFIAGCVNRQSDILQRTEQLNADEMASVVKQLTMFADSEEVHRDAAALDLCDELRRTFMPWLKRNQACSQSNADKADMTRFLCYRLQFPSLVLGGFLFFLWHLYEMWLRTRT